MTQIAVDLLVLNLWAVAVWALASGAARLARSLNAWPGFWLGALALILAPWALAGFAGSVRDALPVAAPPAISAAADAASAATEGPPPFAALAPAAAERDAPFAALEAPVLPVAGEARAASAGTEAAPTGPLETQAAATPAAPFEAIAPGGPDLFRAPAQTFADAANIVLEIPLAVAGRFGPAVVARARAVVTSPAAAWALGGVSALYLLIAAGLAARGLAGGARVEAHARRGRPIAASGAPVPVIAVDAALPPCALGLPRRRILVPESLLRRADSAELAMILRHEAAHIRRGDPETTVLLGLVSALFWINPAARDLVRRWRLAAEIQADAAAAGQAPQAERAAYARLLVTALRERRSALAAAPAAALRLDQKGSVKMRLSAILEGAGGRASRRMKLTAGVAALALGGTGLAGFGAVAQTAGGEAEPEGPVRLIEPDPQPRPEADPRPDAQPRPQPDAQPQIQRFAQASQDQEYRYERDYDYDFDFDFDHDGALSEEEEAAFERAMEERAAAWEHAAEERERALERMAEEREAQAERRAAELERIAEERELVLERMAQEREAVAERRAAALERAAQERELALERAAEQRERALEYAAEQRERAGVWRRSGDGWTWSSSDHPWSEAEMERFEAQMERFEDQMEHFEDVEMAQFEAEMGHFEEEMEAAGEAMEACGEMLGDAIGDQVDARMSGREVSDETMARIGEATACFSQYGARMGSVGWDGVGASLAVLGDDAAWSWVFEGDRGLWSGNRAARELTAEERAEVAEAERRLQEARAELRQAQRDLAELNSRRIRAPQAPAADAAPASPPGVPPARIISGGPDRALEGGPED